MAGRVIWTQTAWSDLEAVADYIAKDSRHYAAAFVGEVRDAARSLASLAERGRIVPEFHDPSVRELCSLLLAAWVKKSFGKNRPGLASFLLTGLSLPVIAVIWNAPTFDPESGYRSTGWA